MRPLTLVSGMRRNCSGRRREAESRITTTSVVRLPSKTWATVAPRVAVSTASSASSGRSPTLASAKGRSRTVTSGATGGGSYCTSVAPRTLADGLGHAAGGEIEAVEVVAEELHHHLCGGTGERLLDSLREEAADGEVDAGNSLQRAAQVVLHRLRGLAGERHQVHLELGVVGAPGVLGELGAPGALGHEAHALVLEQPGGDDPAEPHRFLERGAGDGRHVNEVVPLAELGEEGGPEERQRGDGTDAEDHRSDEDSHRLLEEGREQPRVAALEVEQHRATRDHRCSAG